MSLADNLENLKKNIPNNVTLVAVSKTKPVEDILEVYNAGQLDFGENKVQEMIDKQPELPEDIRWHLIGHLQRNKVKYIAPFVHLIHSVDSLRLLKEINKQAKRAERVIPCLLQLKIAEEETKFGLDKDEAKEILETYSENYKNVTLNGLMGMATFTDDMNQVKREFAYLKSVFDEFKPIAEKAGTPFESLSMGMSGDYELAIQEGSNMIRVGSLIFGERSYP